MASVAAPVSLADFLAQAHARVVEWIGDEGEVCMAEHPQPRRANPLTLEDRVAHVLVRGVGRAEHTWNLLDALGVCATDPPERGCVVAKGLPSALTLDATEFGTVLNSRVDLLVPEAPNRLDDRAAVWGDNWDNPLARLAAVLDLTEVRVTFGTASRTRLFLALQSGPPRSPASPSAACPFCQAPALAWSRPAPAPAPAPTASL